MSLHPQMAPPVLSALVLPVSWLHPRMLTLPYPLLQQEILLSQLLLAKNRHSLILTILGYVLRNLLLLMLPLQQMPLSQDEEYQKNLSQQQLPTHPITVTLRRKYRQLDQKTQ